MTSQSEIKRLLPAHLRQFVADQNYETRYTAQDHAVWRFVMNQLVNQLKTSAHPVYFEGLTRTGISLDAIPSIDAMNECLAKLGWRAIVVDGFIPPQAFMELQSLRVLAIALDMRSVQHIEYTPAPDIIHEAAGHAPIIADVEYSDYLQRFGEVGMKAIYNQYDLKLYEAVRQLSIVKESSDASSEDVATAEKQLDDLVADPGQPSELALLTRLHWWTVEYGLVGDVENYSIYGAGLLSSLSESKSCLDDKKVKKRPLTVDAIKTPYDITRQQPQLFVTKSCRHLTQILNEYARTMSYQNGGTHGLETALEAGVVTSSRYSSGITVSGKINRVLKNAIDEPIYLGTEGPTQLSFESKELDGHGIEYHAQGFGSPIGRICNLMKPLEHASEYELQEMDIRRGESTRLEFTSGITVQGTLNSLLKMRGNILLMSFDDCTVTGPEQEVLFEPAWGTYDMAVGESITSVYAGSADPTRFDVYPSASKTTAPPSTLSRVDELYAALDDSNPEQLADRVLVEAPEEWLLLTDLVRRLPKDSNQSQQVMQQLASSQKSNPALKHLIDRALAI